ncbi:suppressor of fused domain protein [Fontivita pretiosa]|uniref:suppressor of fused domain protein n=1 Tax=Fontivita pretiosa TaxID=2989684 RepID=UPI003D17C479
MLSWVRNILSSSRAAEERQRWWDARLAALEAVLGKCDGTIYQPAPPRHRLGYADVLRFRNYVNGIAYVTCDLIGNPNQVPNKWGHYELMLCTRQENDWAPELLSRLAQYTHEATLHPGDTMDLGDSRPPRSTIAALIFARPDPPADSFTVLGTPANLILGIGITLAEFAACKNFGSGVMFRMLRENHVYPFTDLHRPSVT